MRTFMVCDLLGYEVSADGVLTEQTIGSLTRSIAQVPSEASLTLDLGRVGAVDRAAAEALRAAIRGLRDRAVAVVVRLPRAAAAAIVVASWLDGLISRTGGEGVPTRRVEATLELAS